MWLYQCDLAIHVQLAARGLRPRTSSYRLGMPVAWFRLERLGMLMRAHRADDTLGGAVVKIVRAEPVVIDDVGPLPVGAGAAQGPYRIADAVYERNSVAVSSNLHPSCFDDLMPRAPVRTMLTEALCTANGDWCDGLHEAVGISPVRCTDSVS